MLGICNRNVRVSTKCECAFAAYEYRENSTFKKIYQLSTSLSAKRLFAL